MGLFLGTSTECVEVIGEWLNKGSSSISSYSSSDWSNMTLGSPWIGWSIRQINSARSVKSGSTGNCKKENKSYKANAYL